MNEACDTVAHSECSDILACLYDVPGPVAAADSVRVRDDGDV